MVQSVIKYAGLVGRRPLSSFGVCPPPKRYWGAEVAIGSNGPKRLCAREERRRFASESATIMLAGSMSGAGHGGLSNDPVVVRALEAIPSIESGHSGLR